MAGPVIQRSLGIPGGNPASGPQRLAQALLHRGMNSSGAPPTRCPRLKPPPVGRARTRSTRGHAAAAGLLFRPSTLTVP